MIQDFADWLVYGLFGLSADTPLGVAVNFFFYDTIKILILLFFISVLMGIINAYFPIERLRNYLVTHKMYGLQYVLASIFGASAVFYASILNFPSTLLIFVFGTLFISGGQGKMRFDWRTLYCPAMIASYLSILIVVTGWVPPRVISTPFVLLGNVTVPAALLIIGSSIARVPIRRMFGNTAIYLMSVLRLMLVPLLILYLSRLCRVEETIASINVVLAAMPVASYGTLFCIQYQKGEIIMAEGTFLTTLLSVLSIPLLTMFL